MKHYVFDSYALLAYCEGEKGAREVAAILKKALSSKVQVSLSVLNWGEMYYIALREGGRERAELYRLTIAKYPISIVDANQEITLQAAHYKASFQISYADAFAAALTKLKGAELVTGDAEFRPLTKEIKIHWLP